MKAKDFIALLKEVPAESEIRVYAGCDFKGDLAQRELDYEASVAYSINDDGDKVLMLNISELDAYQYMEKDTETRTVEWVGEETEIDLYRVYHRYENQGYYEGGFPVDPILREHFDMTPNELRESQEVSDWWGKPFIVTQEYSAPDASYTEYVDRMSAYKMDGFELDTEEQFNQRIAEGKKTWFEAWPSGIRYEARCLDGGAWDRSSSKGMFSSMELAVFACERVEANGGHASIISEADLLKEFESN